MLAAQAEGFEKALARRRGIDAQLAQIVADDCDRRRRMLRRLVLDDLECSQPRALVAAAADEQPPIGRGRKQRRACRRQIGVGIEIVRDPDCMADDRRLDIPFMVDVDAAHELDQLTGLRALMRPFSVYRFTDQMKNHRIVSHLRCALIPPSGPVCKNYRASDMRDNSDGKTDWSVPIQSHRRASGYHADTVRLNEVRVGLLEIVAFSDAYFFPVFQNVA